MKRLTDKELHDAITGALTLGHGPYGEVVHLIAYAQLRALERLADNVFNLDKTLAVIRADLARPADGRIIDDGMRA